MKRREFITLLGGAAAAWPLAARAQQPGRLPTIGYLGAGASTAESPWTAAFMQRLRELGWIEGRTIAVELAGQRAVATAMPKSRPTWSSSRLRSLSHIRRRRSLPRSRQHQLSRLSSR